MAAAFIAAPALSRFAARHFEALRQLFAEAPAIAFLHVRADRVETAHLLLDQLSASIILAQDFRIHPKVVEQLPGQPINSKVLQTIAHGTQHADRCGTSQFALHPSRVTRHASPVTRHPPPVTRHPSPVTHHASRITHHASLVTRHPPRRLRVFSLDNFFCPARESLQFPFHHACARISCFRKKAATELNKHSRNHGLRGGHGPPETLPGYRVRRRGEPHGISHASQLPDSG